MRRALAVVFVCAVVAGPLLIAACSGTGGPPIGPAGSSSQSGAGTSGAMSSGSGDGTSGSANGTSQDATEATSSSGSSTSDSGTSSGNGCVNVDAASLPTACEVDSDCTFGPSGLLCDGACCGYAPMNKAGLVQVEAATAQIRFGACPCAHPSVQCKNHTCAL
jgi:hypothetical protein